MQRNDALLALIKSIDQELAIRTEQHVGYQPLPISEHTGEPYNPEWGYQFNAPKSRNPLLNRPSNPNLDITIRKGYDGLDVILISLLSRLFRRREKPRPKQEHVSLFEIAPYELFAMCICGEVLERGGNGHVCLDQGATVYLVDERLISEYSI